MADGPAGDGSTGDAPVDTSMEGAPPQDSGHDGGSDASDGAILGPVPRPIAVAGSVSTATGNAQQVHLIYPQNSDRYWLLYIDDASTSLRTRWSTDLTNWTDGTTLTLPMGQGGEGRNFSVAYKNIAGVDVVHVATSLHSGVKHVVYDTRATISGGTITFGTPVLVHDLDTIDTWVDAAYQAGAGTQGGPECDPDGTGVAIAADGTVHVATAWVAIPGCCYCDANFTHSLSPDLGTSWTGGFASPMDHFTVTLTTNSRQLVAMAAGGLLASWDTADSPLTNVTYATEEAGAWSAAQKTFVPSDFDDMDKDDWSFCRIDDAHTYALRSGYTNLDFESKTYELFSWDGAAWTSQPPPAPELGFHSSGVVLLSNGTSLLAAAIVPDGRVRYATWQTGTGGWTAWSDLVGPLENDAGPGRLYLAGTGCADFAHPVLLWTEGAAAPYTIVATPVASLLP
jgi:hypothetical protein